MSKPTHYPPYPEYKNSGIEWLGPIPAHWEVQKLKHISSVAFSSVDKHTIEGEQPVRLCNYVDVYYNDQITDVLEFMQATATPDEITKFSLQGGDVIVTKDSESWDDIAVAAHVPAKLEGILCGYHLALIRPKPQVMEGQYLFRSFGARGIDHQFKVAATGITRYGLGKYWLDNSFFPIPPLPEQHAIAAFLYRETAKLDNLIAKKRRLIELLGEQRAALISQAVTKGLNPDAAMKDSGVEWLGEIPAHWEVARLKFIADSIQTGPFGSQLHTEEYISGGTPVINPANIQNGRIVPDLDCAIDDPTLKRLSRYKLNEDDIVFARRGEMGRCALVTNIEDGWLCGTGSIRIRLRAELCYSPYLHLVLSGQGVKDWLSLESVGSTMENLNSSILSRMPVPTPSKLEQLAIATYIDCETAKIDALIGKTEETIKKLQAYRTALISAAVTGKIDVRQGVRSRE